jgi:hypothetical protein
MCLLGSAIYVNDRMVKWQHPGLGGHDKSKPRVPRPVSTAAKESGTARE